MTRAERRYWLARRKSDENQKTDIELVQLICFKASSCSLMWSEAFVDKINWLRRE